MSLRLPKLEKNNPKIRELGKDLPEGWKDVKDIFYYQSILFVPKIICLKIISRHYNNPLAGYFGIKKARKFVTKKYFWLILC